MKLNRYPSIIITCAVILCFAAATRVSAQPALKWQLQERPFYVQPKIGLSEYFGDINPDDLYNRHAKPAMALEMGFSLSPMLGMRFELMGTRLYSEKPALDRKLSAGLADATASLVLNLNSLLPGSNPNPRVSGFLLGGLGLVSYRSTLSTLSTAAVISQHEGSRGEWMLPFGGGMGIRLSKRMSLQLEYVSRITGHDDRMDFSYMKGLHDWYSVASAGFRFRIGGTDSDGNGLPDKVMPYGN